MLRKVAARAANLLSFGKVKLMFALSPRKRKVASKLFAFIIVNLRLRRQFTLVRQFENKFSIALT